MLSDGTAPEDRLTSSVFLLSKLGTNPALILKSEENSLTKQICTLNAEESTFVFYVY